MSNQAKNWQEGIYNIYVKGNYVEAVKGYIEEVNGRAYYKKRSVEVRCAPEDEFSLSLGVALAMDKLSKELGKDKIEVGDKVKIKDSSLSYPSCTCWIKKNIDDVGLAACFAYNQIPHEDGAVYVVKVIASWSTEYEGDKKLAYVQKYSVYNNGKVSDNEVCYLMEVDGLEKNYE